jgi:hypothetical protein
VLYNKKPKMGLIITSCIVIFSLLLRVLPLLFGIKPYRLIIFTHTFEQILESSVWYYTSTTVYISSYFVGIVIGYIILDYKFSINKILEIFLWILSIVLITASLLWENSFWKLNTMPTNNSMISWYLWFTFGRFGHTLGFGWVFYELCTGRGGLNA